MSVGLPYQKRCTESVKTGAGFWRGDAWWAVFI